MDQYTAQEFKQASMIFAASVRAIARIEGMKAENAHRLSLGQSIAYNEESFNNVVAEENIQFDSVIEVIQGNKYI